MWRLMVLVSLSALAAAVALLLQRRRPDAPSAPSYHVPTQLDRSDFEEADTPVLVACFTSRTCNSCAATWQAVLAGVGDTPAIVVQNIELQDDPLRLHERYKIDGVPTTLVAGPQGIVHASFFGQMTPQAISAAIT